MVAYVYLITYRRACSEKHRRRLTASTIRTMFTVLWPVVLLCVVPKEDCQNVNLLVPLACVTALWAIDSYLLHYAPSSDSQDPVSLRIDPATITGVAFGLFGLMGSREPNNPHVHPFVFSILGCVAVLMPVPQNLARGSMEDQVVTGVQRGVILWCIGTLVAGVVLMRSNALRNSNVRQQAVA